MASKQAVASAGLVALCLTFGCVSEKAAHRSYYSYPLNSPGTQFGSLPSAAQNTVRAQAGASIISQIIPISAPGGAQTFAVFFENSEAHPPLYVAEDGSVLDRDLRVVLGAPGDPVGMLAGSGRGGLLLGDLPPAAIRAIREAQPTGTIKGIDRQTWGDRSVYRIIFDGPGERPAIYVTAEGTVLKQEPE